MIIRGALNILHDDITGGNLHYIANQTRAIKTQLELIEIETVLLSNQLTEQAGAGDKQPAEQKDTNKV